MSPRPSGPAAAAPDACAPAPEDAALIDRSGLFDHAFYALHDPSTTRGRAEALAHWREHGWRAGWRPNFYFDTVWYLALHEDVRSSGADPLLHYLTEGERDGRRPCAIFDPAWYAAEHGLAPGEPRLAHFLRNRAGGAARGVELFDPGFYLAAYPDIAAAAMDPLEHYLVQGYREGRRPFAAFEPAFYRDRYLRDWPDANPLLHYLRHGRAQGARIARPEGETTIAREVRRHTRPGPGFEEPLPLAPDTPRRARVLAFYLPQFHPIAENDRWWGEGFTEWTSIARGLPRFAGHWQPRVPRDLGHYRLDAANAPAILRRQAALARDAGIEGFVFYYYWFNGRRLLDGPIEALLADPTIALPFCLMWANENWTRRWDGSDDDILIRQDYRPEDEAALLADWDRHVADPRYIRIGGRPVLMVYRAALIPETAATVARWRKRLSSGGRAPPLFVMAQSFGASDPLLFGFDAAVEFPPHKICDDLAAINPTLDLLDTDFTGRVHDYAAVAEASLSAPAPPFPLIRTVCPSWDNDARRQGAGIVLHGATPALFADWLGRAARRARDETVLGDAVVCVNAWNEWAEGAHLEPDQFWGHAFLNAAGRAVTADDGSAAGEASAYAEAASVLLLVGHDALRHGAQFLLLALGRQLRAAHGVRLAVLLGAGGPLVADYEALGPVTVAERHDLAEAAATLLDGRGGGRIAGAIVNSLASGAAAGALAARGVPFVALAHEMPRLVREKGLAAVAAELLAKASRVVVAAPEVAAALDTLRPEGGGSLASRALVLPQGLYRPIPFAAAARARGRAALGAAAGETVALGVGYADLRKGFDRFLAAFRTLHAADPAAVRFVWAGGIDPTLADYLADDIDAALATGRFHMPGFVDAPDALYAAADCLLLPSREDPFPSVVLEAMSCGLPVVAFEGAGGIPALLRETGAGIAVAPGDGPAYVAAIGRVARDRRATARRAAAAARHADRIPSLADYAHALLGIALPGVLDVSVVVPAFDSAATIEARLGSIWAQTHPVREVIVLDDASVDDTVARAEAAAAAAGRAITLHRNVRNSGSVFRQWEAAARRAGGEWLWIAEADDLSEPGFLAALAVRLRDTPRAVFGFTDSRAVDADGLTVSASYRDYARASGCDLLDRDATVEGADFLRRCLAERNLVLNASAVLFRREALLAAIGRVAEPLGAMRVAGDWLLYAAMLSAADVAVAYVASPLNVHRRHAASVTARTGKQRHFDEVCVVQDAIEADGAARLTADDRRRQLRYRATLGRTLGLRAVAARAATRRPSRRSRTETM